MFMRFSTDGRARLTWTLPLGDPKNKKAGETVGAHCLVKDAKGNIYIGDIWRFDGKNWTDLKPAAPLPSIRGRLAGDWDFVRSRLVIFGGQGTTGAKGAIDRINTMETKQHLGG